ncbi:hypothetical protein K440DRAFT_637368 [Wilcoxina mikolae CBS 423.85]|nr:hypothetical protein K440DRAFT_637368 [Wilcoxina mikolae CBS 423.85]
MERTLSHSRTRHSRTARNMLLPIWNFLRRPAQVLCFAVLFYVCRARIFKNPKFRCLRLPFWRSFLTKLSLSKDQNSNERTKSPTTAADTPPSFDVPLRPITIRFQSIPSGVTENDLRGVLGSLDNEGKDTEILHLSLAEVNSQQVATVSYGNVPKIFERCDRYGPEVRIAFPEYETYADANFIGLTALCTPDAPIVDIVVVCGLGGHAFGSWKASHQQNWLRDFLPSDLESNNLRARILTYGYDSKLVKSLCNTSIHDLSGRFLEALKNARTQLSEAERPLIFLGHSLGGLIIKHALKEAGQGGEAEIRIFKSCHSIIFFGVPNKGIATESLMSMVEGQPNEQLVRNILPGSQLLEELEKEFYRQFIDKLKDSEVISFYETKASPTTQVNSSTGQWERTGPKQLLVTKDSATRSTRGGEFHHQLAIQADHLSMVKFGSPHSEDYQMVLGRLVTLMKEAPCVVSKRFQPYRQRLSEVELKCIKALNSPDYLGFRERQIAKQSKDTLQWVTNNEEIQNWISDKTNMALWIKGTPGQGKTVLSRFLIKQLEQRTISQTVSGGEAPGQSKVIYFFFYQQDPNLRTVSAALRSLIDQLLIAPPLFQHILKFYGREGSRFARSNEILWKIFKDIIQDPYFGTIYCVIDALDECEIQTGKDSRKEFLDRIGELLSAQGRAQKHSCKLLITSRPEVDILRCLNNLPLLDLKAHEGDIDRHIEEEVSKLPNEFSPATRDTIEFELKLRSETTFLWTSIVLKDVSRMVQPTPLEIRNKIAQLPGDLDKLYRDLVAKTLEREGDKARLTMLWVAYAKRPLSLRELQAALATKPNSRSKEETLDNMPTITVDSIGRLAGMVLKVVPDSKGRLQESAKVEFIHQSMKEFCIQSGILLDREDLNLVSPAQAPVHPYLAKVCLAYLNFEDLVSSAPLWNSKPMHGYSFVNYAVENWHHHSGDDYSDIKTLLYPLVDPQSPTAKFWCFNSRQVSHTTELILDSRVPHLGRFVFSEHNTKLSKKVPSSVVKRVAAQVFDIMTTLIDRTSMTVMEVIFLASEVKVFPEHARLRKPALYRILREDPAKFFKEVAHQIFQRSHRITILNLLARDPYMGISAADAEVIAKRQDNDLTLHLLRRKGKVEITEVVFMEFVRTYDRQVMERLLSRTRDMKITNAILDVVLTNEFHGEEVLEFLLANWPLADSGDEVWI